MLTQPTLDELTREAWEVGKTIDLTGIGYGLESWGERTNVITSPFPYYYFLAGLVRVTQSTRIIEIGTHHGGSARALAAGSPDARIITFDVKSDAVELIGENKQITACVMDANTHEGIAATAAHFSNERPDLLYIDANHTFWPTFLNFSIYVTAFNPRFVVLDDIHLFPDMTEMWEWIKQGRDAVNAADIVPQIRATVGFGLIRS